MAGCWGIASVDKNSMFNYYEMTEREYGSVKCELFESPGIGSKSVAWRMTQNPK